MIYLDSAATSLHRPESVIRAVCEGMQCLGNPGRGAYDAALEAGRTVYQARKKIGSLFGMEDPSRVVFTANVTEALNLAVSSLFGSPPAWSITVFCVRCTVRKAEALR